MPPTERVVVNMADQSNTADDIDRLVDKIEMLWAADRGLNSFCMVKVVRRHHFPGIVTSLCHDANKRRLPHKP